MAKVIIHCPYSIKTDRRKELYETYKKQWDSGVLVLDGCVQVTVFRDEDVIDVTFKEEPDNG